jgi:hypothetical protein
MNGAGFVASGKADHPVSAMLLGLVHRLISSFHYGIHRFTLVNQGDSDRQRWHHLTGG